MTATIRARNIEVVIHFPILPKLRSPLRRLRGRPQEMATPTPAAEAPAVVATAATTLAIPPPPTPAPTPVKRYGWCAYRQRDPETGRIVLHVMGRFRPPSGYDKCRFLLLEDVGGRASQRWEGESSGMPVLVLERFIVPPPLAADGSVRTSSTPRIVSGSASRTVSSSNSVCPSADAPVGTAESTGESESADADTVTPEAIRESTVEILFEKQEMAGALQPLFAAPYAIGRLDDSQTDRLYTHVTILPEGVTLRIKNL